MQAVLQEPSCDEWRQAAIGLLGSSMTGHTPIFGEDAEDKVDGWTSTQIRQYVIENGGRLDVFGFEITDAIKEIIIAEGEYRLDLLRKQV